MWLHVSKRKNTNDMFRAELPRTPALCCSSGCPEGRWFSPTVSIFFCLLPCSERLASQHDFRCFPVAFFLSLLVSFFEPFQAAHECGVGCFFAHPAVHQLFHDGRLHVFFLRIRLHFGLDLRVFDPSVVRHSGSLVAHRAYTRASRHRPPHRATRERRVGVDACSNSCNRNPLVVVDEACADVAGTHHRTPGADGSEGMLRRSSACTNERSETPRINGRRNAAGRCGRRRCRCLPRKERPTTSSRT
mmetsp:Transcript_5790/g.20272  ORF Transcript_5790/g.20272 Transcript_5790/m.20272 type:complete len:246 (+) Transcript_5790:1095-1832(+)